MAVTPRRSIVSRPTTEAATGRLRSVSPCLIVVTCTLSITTAVSIASGASSCVRTVRRGSACAHSAATQSRRHTQKRRRNGVGIIALNFTAK